jgi:hypothetical protein
VALASSIDHVGYVWQELGIPSRFEFTSSGREIENYKT